MVDEVNGGELFYYFIESEGNPSEDPVLLWLTGGYRCSALSGLIFEIGPLKIVKVPYNGSIPALEYHPYAWTKNASIIFLDSPLGAGFSYSSNPKGYEIGDTAATLQICKFLLQWVVDHPHYLAHPFYVAGDSYAGKIVPFVAQLISEGIEAGRQQLGNLKGYLIGNPSTGEKIDLNSRVPYAHGHGIISDQLFELTQKSCVGEDYTNPSTVLCAEVLDVVEDLILKVSKSHILERPCILVSPTTKDFIQNRRFLKDDYYIQLSQPEEPPFYCRSYSYYLSYFWANDNATREALGIKKGTVNEWLRCRKLPYEIDIKSSIKYHLNLTSKGYRALVYSGDHDLLVPFLGTQAWVRSLNFTVVDGWRAWHVDGQTGGFTETYSNNLTFATIKGGGHTAPEYQPKECMAMFGRWISNQPL
ncbi:Serine carboxypeptidase-like 19 [Carex littledalei]|uniref:Serine carboxypeptidase-like 19 n=1 Tax=Carex littledalei TaxID=544730 RepID=A0A833VD72_9POAL|nr:Serine carboxypeptidase-like 19 [Carex littledalei]